MRVAGIREIALDYCSAYIVLDMVRCQQSHTEGTKVDQGDGASSLGGHGGVDRIKTHHDKSNQEKGAEEDDTRVLGGTLCESIE